MSPDFWEFVKLAGIAGAVYAAIRADLAYLRAKVESHSEQIGRLNSHFMKMKD